MGQRSFGVTILLRTWRNGAAHFHVEVLHLQHQVDGSPTKQLGANKRFGHSLQRPNLRLAGRQTTALMTELTERPGANFARGVEQQPHRVSVRNSYTPSNHSRSGLEPATWSPYINYCCNHGPTQILLRNFACQATFRQQRWNLVGPSNHERDSKPNRPIEIKAKTAGSKHKSQRNARLDPSNG